MNGQRYKNGLNYEESKALGRAMAVEAWCSEAAEGMIVRNVSERSALYWAAESDANRDCAGVQDWRRLERHMANALIALGHLGYEVVKKQK